MKVQIAHMAAHPPYCHFALKQVKNPKKQVTMHNKSHCPLFTRYSTYLISNTCHFITDILCDLWRNENGSEEFYGETDYL